MTFQEALNKLDIEDYGERIFNSNSHGELFHIVQYIHIAENLKNDNGWFRDWFVAAIALAEDTMERPNSIFQHIETMMVEWIEYMKTKRQSNEKSKI